MSRISVPQFMRQDGHTGVDTGLTNRPLQIGLV
jgi:hypothetical protein